MEKRICAVRSLVIILYILAVAFLNPNFGDTQSNDTSKYQGLQVYYNPEYLPFGTPNHIIVEGKRFYFNSELWVDKAIVVYGDPVILNPRSTDFASDTGSNYYQRNGVTGEYRYHGYAASGTIFTNNDFPDDFVSGKLSEEKLWIHEPWITNPDQASVWNRVAYESTLLGSFAKQKIKEYQPFKIKYSTSKTAQRDTDGFLLAHEHSNVLSASDLRFHGEGKMWTEYNGKHYWDTISYNVAQSKRETELVCNVQILNKDQISFDQDGKATIEFMIQGTMKDAAVVGNEVHEAIYYHREDVEYFKLKYTADGMTDQIITINPLAGNGITLDPLGISWSTKITTEIDANALDGAFNVTGYAWVEYFESKVSNSYSDSDQAVLNDGLKSHYTVENIQLTGTETLSVDKFVYKDKSIGKWTDMKFYVGLTEDTLVEVYTSANETFNESEINKAISDYATPIYERSVNPVGTLYATKQVLRDASGNVSEKIVWFSISQGIAQVVDLNLDLPSQAFDIVPYGAKNHSDTVHMQGGLKVDIDGESVNAEDFFSPTWAFGASDVDKVVKVTVRATSTDNVEAYWEQWVRVLSTKPRVQLQGEGTTKENRLVTLTNASQSVNDPILWDAYPITSYTWEYITLEGDTSSWNRIDHGDSKREIQIGKEGFYRVRLIGENELGRKSDPYEYDMYILKDYQPDVILNIWNSVMSRNESIHSTYAPASLDGDLLESQVAKLVYDSDEDGTYEEVVRTGTPVDILNYVPTRLGRYQIHITVKESFGEEYLPQFVSPEDRRSKTVIRDLFVDNLRPIVKMDVDLTPTLESVDVYILTDQNVSRDINSAIRDNRINYNNQLRTYGLDANVQHRDLFTYHYSQPVSTAQNTGRSYPANTLNYSSSGYTGTLSRYSVVDNGYNEDQGRYRTERSCRTVTTYERVCNGRLCGWFTMPDGFTWCTWCDVPSGTREECTTNRYWDSDWVWISNYTGYYQGTVHKYVKQDYRNPFRTQADRYVIYVGTESTSLADFQEVEKNNDFKTILVGPAALAQHFSEVAFHSQNSDIASAMDEVIDFIAGQFPAPAMYRMLKGGQVDIQEVYADGEGDPIVPLGWQVVQEEVFDNPEGLISGSRTEFGTRASDWQASIDNPLLLNRVGKYTLYRQWRDETGQANYNKESNLSSVTITVHRKPVADCSLDWKWEDDHYKTTWVDQSYDPDFQYSRPDKGVVDRKIRYRQTGGNWKYAIPDQLLPGQYELEYTVKDLYGIWSDTYTSTFTLDNAPPIQLAFEVKATRSSDQITALAASESITLYDMWTRYPYDHTVQAILKSGALEDALSPEWSSATPNLRTVQGQDYWWHDQSLHIPEATADGTYMVRLLAKDSTRGQSISKDRPIIIQTPINLTTSMETMVIAGQNNVISAETSKYVSSLSADLFTGTPFERRIDLEQVSMDETTPSGSKQWSLTETIDNAVTDGIYTCTLTAVTPSGKKETLDVDVTVQHLQVQSVHIRGAWNHWRGQTDLLGKNLENNPMRFLSLEAVTVEAEVIGFPEKVEMRLTPELEAMTYTNSQGDTYTYEELIGQTVLFPVQLKKQEDLSAGRSRWVATYILPMAPETMSWEDQRLRSAYWLEVTAHKSGGQHGLRLEGIELTGNTSQLLYSQPE